MTTEKTTSPGDLVTIKVTRRLRETLKAMGVKGETYSEVIQRLLGAVGGRLDP